MKLLPSPCRKLYVTENFIKLILEESFDIYMSEIIDKRIFPEHFPRCFWFYCENTTLVRKYT